MVNHRSRRKNIRYLVLAAGKGSRLAKKGPSKPLLPLLGVPLLKRAILTAKNAGGTDFTVVTGYNGEKVQSFLEDFAKQHQIRIHTLPNEAWEKGNGLSVLKAKDHLKEPFILIMSDHILDGSILQNLQSQKIEKDEIALAVDRNMSNPLIDRNDVTKVQTENGNIVAIGKSLNDYNAFDTGAFFCTPHLFSALEKSRSKNNDTSLSGGIQELAKEGKAKIFDIKNHFWIDVDNPKDLKTAGNELLRRLKKPNDGPISRFLNRPLSIQISRFLVKFPITPNQISFVCFLLSGMAAFLFCLKGYGALAAGAVLAQFASIVDGCDGEVARLKFLESDYGGWFDAVLDRYADAFLIMGLTWHAFEPLGNKGVLLAGFLALTGSFMTSYTADKYDRLMQSQITKGWRFRMGRDVRVFLIFLGALLNLPYPTLILIAVLMNAETIRRIIICRDPA